MQTKKMPFTSPEILEHYDGYYDDSILKWRQLGAKFKAQNIVQMCAGVKHDSVLDIGAGEGSVSFALTGAGFSTNIQCLEISSSALEYIRRNKASESVRDMGYDGTTIPFPDDHFDLAFASHVLEHVENERIFIREAARVAKYLFIEVPLEDTLRSPSIYSPDGVGHINFYNRKTIRKLLESIGLQVMELKLFHTPYEVFAFSGAVSGAFKYSICRSAALFGHKFASALFTYHCGILCRK